MAGNCNGQTQGTSPACLVGMRKSVKNSVRMASIRLTQRRGSPGIFSSSAAYWSAAISVLCSKNIIRSPAQLLVGTATRYGLDGPGIESRWGAKFSTPIHTSPGVHAAPYKIGTRSFPGVKRLGRDVDHHKPLAPRSKKQ